MYKQDVIGNALIHRSLTTEVLSNGRVGSNSTNKQKDEEKQDDTPLQPRQLLPFLQTEEDRKMKIQYRSILFVGKVYNSAIYYNKFNN